MKFRDGSVAGFVTLASFVTLALAPGVARAVATAAVSSVAVGNMLALDEVAVFNWALPASALAGQ